MSLSLRDWQTLDASGLAALHALQIDPAQVEFAGTLERALASCAKGPPGEIAGLAIEQDGAVVGFVVLQHGSRRPDWAPEGAAAVSAMRIDRHRQGQGLGRAALAAVDDWLRRHWPAAKQVALSVDEGNAAGRRAYAQAGYVECAPPKPGRIGRVRFLAKAV
jgi:GNAT superfamily N-acetyltransferase